MPDGAPRRKYTSAMFKITEYNNMGCNFLSKLASQINDVQCELFGDMC